MRNANVRNGVECVIEFLRRLGRSTAGTGVPEYALILALIVGGGIVGYISLGRVATDAFHRSSQVAQTFSRGAATRIEMPASTHSQFSRTETHATTRSAGTLAFMVLGLVVGIAVSSASFLAWRARQPTIASTNEDAGAEKVANVTLPVGARERIFEKRQQLCRLMTRSLDDTTDATIEVQYLMSQNLMTITPTMPTAEAAEIMDSERIRHLLVCKGNGQLVGIISDRDIKERDGKSVADIMTPDPLTVTPQTELNIAISIMLNKCISGLPVVENDRVCGFLSTTDLIMSLQCVLHTLNEIMSGAKPAVHAEA